MPPPRMYRHRYHGALALNARIRSRVIALRPSELVDPPLPPDDDIEPSEAPGSQASSQATEGSSPSGRSARIRWAQLLARPQGDFLLDQSLRSDLTEADPVPEFEFDQSGPEFEFDQSLPDRFDG